jgi:hypothetical protein
MMEIFNIVFELIIVPVNTFIYSVTQNRSSKIIVTKMKHYQHEKTFK